MPAHVTRRRRDGEGRGQRERGPRPARCLERWTAERAPVVGDTSTSNRVGDQRARSLRGAALGRHWDSRRLLRLDGQQRRRAPREQGTRDARDPLLHRLHARRLRRRLERHRHLARRREALRRVQREAAQHDRVELLERQHGVGVEGLAGAGGAARTLRHASEDFLSIAPSLGASKSRSRPAPPRARPTRRTRRCARSISSAWSCSGDMYASFPLSCPSRVDVSAHRRLGHAEVDQRACPSTPTRMFCGDTSRWTIPSGSPGSLVASCAACSPRSTPTMMRRGDGAADALAAAPPSSGARAARR